MRDLFLASMLNQDIEWYDVNRTGDFSSRVADDLKKVEEGIGDKVSIFIFYEMTFVFCVLQGMLVGLELSLVCLVALPITLLAMGFLMWITEKLTKTENDAYGEAGAIAEEVLTAIRTVVAFGGEQKEKERYNKLLVSARNNNVKRSFFNGVSNGTIWFSNFASYALVFWYGVKLILKERHLPPSEITYNPASMTIIFFSILVGTFYFAIAATLLEAFATAKGSAAKIFYVIDNTPKINVSKGRGYRPNNFIGNIRFENVSFYYNSRPDVKVLQGLNLTIKPGETVALVGSSGCGKSTCIQLLQRYYDPTYGKIYIDDYPLPELDLTWMRSNIGSVAQEPILFEGTIAENIRFGRESAKQDDIVSAAIKANAHTFISGLPQTYNTIIGERGTQLSGGQKQRIAIARALVRKPSLLLLDEATSALDVTSEAVVQEALDIASSECTTIIVAHRLSTVKKADKIFVLSQGEIIEQGNHKKLMESRGAYYELVIAQVSEDDSKAVTDKEGASTKTFQNGLVTEEEGVSLGLQLETHFQIEEEPVYFWEIMKFNSCDWWIITIGCVCSIINGATMPLYAIIFGNLISVLSSDDSKYVERESIRYSLLFLLLGVLSGFAFLFQTYTFGMAGENITLRLRSRMFEIYLKQEMAWFDDTNQAVGVLCSRLSSEAAQVKGVTGSRMGAVLNAAATIILSVVSCLYHEWRVSLIALSFMPVTIFSIYLEQKIITRDSQSHHSSLEKSTKFAVEAINGIRTIASLGCEKIFHKKYILELERYHESAKRKSRTRGSVYALSRCLMFFSYPPALYYGIQLVINEGLDYGLVFIVCETLITSSWSLGNALAFTPDFQKGLIATKRILSLLKRVPQIQDGSDNVHEKWDVGNINYKDVHFTYPMRPRVPVLNGINLSILQGKMVALVGPSGCGKSTIVQLLERYYDATKGTVMVDGKNIRTMNLSGFRAHLGIVSQEPNLFSITIAENIAYGDNERTVSLEEIQDVAKKANIHNFIASLPLGYHTQLGEKGTQLSGGQKQRIAIARALVRNPKVLLLDEATSALDAESEKIVQEALDKAKIGRTCICIAHRLTTIADADVIYVIQNGKVIEMGKHKELIDQNGFYHNLYTLANK